jgi:hypothetical protein
MREKGLRLIDIVGEILFGDAPQPARMLYLLLYTRR